MARFATAVVLALVGAALADTECASGVCPSDADDGAALLQHTAAHAAKVSAHGNSDANISQTLGCTTTPAKTCGNPSLDCVMDTEQCSSSGGGHCCMAAGNIPGMLQCRFCGEGTSCGPCTSSTTTATTTAAQQPCCRAQTAECLSCSYRVSEEQYCSWYPDTEGCPKKCCKASTAECLSCLYGISEEQYCSYYPDTAGCPQKACCMAMTASCLSCSSGMSEEQYCRENPTTAGCPRPTPSPNCPQPGPMGLNQKCENGPDGYWYGCCKEHLDCTRPAASLGSYHTCQYPTASPYR